MKFVFPRAEHELQAIGFIQEFHEYSSAVSGSGGLDECLKTGSYSDWLEKLQRDIDIANVPEGRVPALTYFYVREQDGKIVGMINIRLALNGFLRKEGGHIGYCVRPTERRKGYCTQMLGEALDFCRGIGMSGFIVSCDKSNPASAGVIKKCGGVLQAEFYSDFFGEVIQRYCIE